MLEKHYRVRPVSRRGLLKGAGGGDNDGLDLITSEPYFNGWLSVVQISKPEELTELITPETYMELNAKPVV
jgi:hypothetical protein